MDLLSWWTRRTAGGDAFQQAERLLEAARRLNRRGEREAVRRGGGRAVKMLEAAERAGFGDQAHFDLRMAEALLLSGKPEEARTPAHRAASARPYDVDSRIVHGHVRLALGELREAAHEFESVLEEFGGDPDAKAGLLAVALARGQWTVEGTETAEDYVKAGDVLINAWDAADRVKEHIQALKALPPAGGDPRVVEVVEMAAKRRR